MAQRHSSGYRVLIETTSVVGKCGPQEPGRESPDVQGTNRGNEQLAWMTVVLSFLACLCEGIDLLAAGLAGPGIRHEVGLGARALGYFFSAGTFGLFIGAIAGGWFADWWGRKRVLVASVVAFGAVALLTALARDAATLATLRLLTGLGLGGALPNAIALGSEVAPGHRRSVYVGIIYAGAPLGGAVAALASLAIPLDGWRVIFIIGGVLPLILAPVMAMRLRESVRFTAVAGRLPDRDRLLELFRAGRAGRTVLLWLSCFCLLLTLYLLLNWLPLLLNDSGVSKATAALALALFNIGGGLSATLITAVMESRWRASGVLVTFVAMPLLLALLASVIGTASATLLVLMLLGTTMLAAQSIVYSISPLVYPTLIRGTGVGLVVAIGRLGSAVGRMLGSVLVQSERSSGDVLLRLLPIAVLASASAMLASWRRVDSAD